MEWNCSKEFVMAEFFLVNKYITFSQIHTLKTPQNDEPIIEYIKVDAMFQTISLYV